MLCIAFIQIIQADDRQVAAFASVGFLLALHFSPTVITVYFLLVTTVRCRTSAKEWH
jgi:hypothetical protein